ncbi:MAG: hypothetical protein IT167_11440 [Bryobacterales bacterium]|nr:hypothetical protein [Bryobacterales bacterium]
MRFARKSPEWSAFLLMAVSVLGADAARGPLRVHPRNPRYFSDGNGKAVYVTGSHTWASLQDYDSTPNPAPFDYGYYLDFLKEHNHNFIRLWAWEAPREDEAEGWTNYLDPMPSLRTGPGKAADGGLKFDLTRFNTAYFDRLRARVVAARDRGIYVSVMLFQGWSVWSYNKARRAFFYHPFHKDNNVNGVDGDPNGSGEGEEAHSLSVPAITRLQEAYVRKVIDTVNDLDNVLFEISNECRNPEVSSLWQYHMIRFIKEYERSKPKQHLVGMTDNGGDNSALFASPADWISPKALSSGSIRRKTDPAVIDPPATEGKKIIVYDTDHLGAHNFLDDAAFSRLWVWKSFTRGYNPILMELHQTNPMGDSRPGLLAARKAMGDTLRYAGKMDLAAMTPRNELASSRYCLANPGKEYLVYLPEGGEVSLDLAAAAGELEVEWFNPRTSAVIKGAGVRGGARRSLRAPFGGDAVLHLAAK